jgi:hypothetical protein
MAVFCACGCRSKYDVEWRCMTGRSHALVASSTTHLMLTIARACFVVCGELLLILLNVSATQNVTMVTVDGFLRYLISCTFYCAVNSIRTLLPFSAWVRTAFFLSTTGSWRSRELVAGRRSTLSSRGDYASRLRERRYRALHAAILERSSSASDWHRVRCDLAFVSTCAPKERP